MDIAPTIEAVYSARGGHSRDITVLLKTVGNLSIMLKKLLNVRFGSRFLIIAVFLWPFGFFSLTPRNDLIPLHYRVLSSS